MAQVGSFGVILQDLFGPTTEVTANVISNMIITIAVWILVAITFGDIIASFSSFSTWVAWVTGILIGIITANLGIMVGIIAALTGIFSFLGVAAVYVGLGAAFVAFLAVNLGVKSLGPWIMQRKAMTEGAKAEAGGTKLAGAITGLKTAGKALAKD